MSVSLLKDSNFNVTPSQAWDEGTNIRVALKAAPEMVRGWIVSEVGRLIKELNYKITISSDEELMFCCRSIIEDHPTLKLEEIRVCFDWIRKGRYGKMFERLKTPEILSFICKYEGETRADMLEQRAENKRKEHMKTLDEVKEALEPLGLTAIYDSIQINEPELKGQGIGTRLRKNWEGSESEVQ